MLIRHVIYFERSSCYGNEKRQNVSLVGDYLYVVGNAYVLTSFNQPKSMQKYKNSLNTLENENILLLTNQYLEQLGKSSLCSKCGQTETINTS